MSEFNFTVVSTDTYANIRRGLDIGLEMGLVNLGTISNKTLCAMAFVESYSSFELEDDNFRELCNHTESGELWSVFTWLSGVRYHQSQGLPDNIVSYGDRKVMVDFKHSNASRLKSLPMKSHHKFEEGGLLMDIDERSFNEFTPPTEVSRELLDARLANTNTQGIPKIADEFVYWSDKPTPAKDIMGLEREINPQGIPKDNHKYGYWPNGEPKTAGSQAILDTHEAFMRDWKAQFVKEDINFKMEENEQEARQFAEGRVDQMKIYPAYTGKATAEGSPISKLIILDEGKDNGEETEKDT